MSIITECLGAADVRGLSGMLECVRRPYSDCEGNSSGTQMALNECAAIARDAWRVRLDEQLEQTRPYVADQVAFDALVHSVQAFCEGSQTDL